MHARELRRRESIAVGHPKLALEQEGQVFAAQLSVNGESVQTEIKSPDDFERLNEAITGTSARDMYNVNNLKQVGLDFHNFEGAYKRLPPQAIST